MHVIPIGSSNLMHVETLLFSRLSVNSTHRYSGLRPATEHRDYQITAWPGQQWITVGGIRSTGLTGSAGIGEYVAYPFRNLCRVTYPFICILLTQQVILSDNIK